MDGGATNHMTDRLQWSDSFKNVLEGHWHVMIVDMGLIPVKCMIDGVWKQCHIHQVPPCIRAPSSPPSSLPLWDVPDPFKEPPCTLFAIPLDMHIVSTLMGLPRFVVNAIYFDNYFGYYCKQVKHALTLEKIC